MTYKILEINPEQCTQRVIDATNDLWVSVNESKPELVTPEHLLLSITMQKEFIGYCNENGCNYTAMQKELVEYVSQIETCSFSKFYFAASYNLNKIRSNVKNLPTRPIGIPDIIKELYNIDDSVVSYVLYTYLGDDIGHTVTGLELRYHDDYAAFHDSMSKNNTQEKPKIRPKVTVKEFIIDGSTLNLPGNPEEIKKRLQQDSHKIVAALESFIRSAKDGDSANLGELLGNSVRNSDDDNDDNDGSDLDDFFGSDGVSEMPTSVEPWEHHVACITEKYKEKNPIIGRKAEMERAIRILCQKDKNNVLFIGEPGVGKTALIYGLAHIINDCDETGKCDGIAVPEWLRNNRIYGLDTSTIVAGASFHGEMERRLKEILEGASNKGNCILFVDDIHNLIETGGGNNTMEAGEILKPYLEDGRLRIIGCTTYQDFNKSISAKKSIVRRFSQVGIKEPSVAETTEILKALIKTYEKHHGVRYADDAIEYAVERSHALIHDRHLPDKALEIIDQAGALLHQSPKLDKNGKRRQTRYQKIDKAVIDRILTEVCRIDAKALTSTSNDTLKNLDKRIINDIYGQDDAVRQVVRSVMMSKAGLLEPDKPIASLLFVGPTGVGKTEVCKVLAKELGIELVRFDMSEYTEKHTISKLIGSPAGYVGYDEGGLLTDAIRKTPNCVLLLDEIEKAHSDIYNILLQVMDYARLTDNKGNRADFRNVILIMTSNAGAQFAGQASIGFGGGQSKGDAMLNTVKKTFKPEFLNRLSGTVVFNEMDRSMASLILDKKLRQLSDRLAAKNATMTLTEGARKFILDKGFTTLYGAREMDRVINQNLTPLLMEELLFGKLKKGGNVTVDVDGETLKVVHSA